MLVLHELNKELGEGIAIWLQPATRRSVSMYSLRYFLSFPPMLFRVGYRTKFTGNNLLCRSLRVGFLTKYKKPTDKTSVYIPLLPNICCGEDADEYPVKNEKAYKQDLHVCMGEDITIVAPDITQLIKISIANFFTSEFNGDVNGTELLAQDKISKISIYGPCDDDSWHGKSKDPIWVPDKKDLIKWGSFKAFAATKCFLSPFETYEL